MELNFTEGREGIQGAVSTGEISLGNAAQRGANLQAVAQLSFVLGKENNKLRDVACVEISAWRGEVQAEMISIKVSNPEVSDSAGRGNVGVRSSLTWTW